jgi:hypothetical protein
VCLGCGGQPHETMIPFRTKNDPVVVPGRLQRGWQDAGRRRGRNRRWQAAARPAGGDRRLWQAGTLCLRARFRCPADPAGQPTTGPPTKTFLVSGSTRSRFARWPRTSRCPGSIGCFQTSSVGASPSLRKTNLQHYLDEFVFRFNRRRTRHAAFETLLGIGARTVPAPYRVLIRKDA